MKLSKRITGLALSAMMVMSQVMPAMATDPTPAAGNVLAYTNNEILAPTAIKVSFNPQGYDVVVRGTGNDAVTKNSQIVALNYGFASNATNDMLAKVSFEASYEAGEGAEKEIEFVSTIEEAQPKTEDNEDGAEKGELKVYLAVATNKTAINASLAADDATFEVDENGASTATAALLCDVDMTAATDGNVPFVDNKADVALKLAKATYTVEEDFEVTFETTQDDLDDHMILAEDGLGGIGGFTFVGAMNTDADWTKAKVEAISITPTFDLTTEATEDDEIIEGTYAQVSTTPAEAAPSIAVTEYTITASDPAVVNLSLGSGDLAAPGDAVTVKFNGSVLNTSMWSYDKNAKTITFATTYTSALAGKTDSHSRVHQIVFDDAAATTVEVTLKW
jgi:hypothetical protein